MKDKIELSAEIQSAIEGLTASAEQFNKLGIASNAGNINRLIESARENGVPEAAIAEAINTFNEAMANMLPILLQTKSSIDQLYQQIQANADTTPIEQQLRQKLEAKNQELQQEVINTRILEDTYSTVHKALKNCKDIHSAVLEAQNLAANSPHLEVNFWPEEWQQRYGEIHFNDDSRLTMAKADYVDRMITKKLPIGEKYPHYTANEEGGIIFFSKYTVKKGSLQRIWLDLVPIKILESGKTLQLTKPMK